MTVHCVSDWEMRSVVLQTRPLYESHTSTHLAEELTNAVTVWNLKRPNVTLPVTTDNAANILSVIHEADGPRPQTGCFAHVANLTAKKAVSINLVSRLLGKVGKVVTFFHKSTTAQHVLTVKQNMLNLPKHKLIHNVVTRWNTIHEMLERFTEQQPAIYSALLDKHMKKSIKDISMLTDSDQKLAELIQLFKPLKTVTTLMSSVTTPTTSMILPLRETILKSTAPGDEDSTTIKEAKVAITNDLKGRYTESDLYNYLLKATVLDPRFKSLPSLDEDSCDGLYRDLITEILEYAQQVLVDYHVFCKPCVILIVLDLFRWLLYILSPFHS